MPPAPPSLLVLFGVWYEDYRDYLAISILAVAAICLVCCLVHYVHRNDLCRPPTPLPTPRVATPRVEVIEEEEHHPPKTLEEREEMLTRLTRQAYERQGVWLQTEIMAEVRSFKQRGWYMEWVDGVTGGEIRKAIERAKQRWEGERRDKRNALKSAGLAAAAFSSMAGRRASCSGTDTPDRCTPTCTPRAGGGAQGSSAPTCTPRAGGGAAGSTSSGPNVERRTPTLTPREQANAAPASEESFQSAATGIGNKGGEDGIGG